MHTLFDDIATAIVTAAFSPRLGFGHGRGGRRAPLNRSSGSQMSSGRDLDRMPDALGMEVLDVARSRFLFRLPAGINSLSTFIQLEGKNMYRVILVCLSLTLATLHDAGAAELFNKGLYFSGPDQPELFVDDCDRSGSDFICDIRVTVKPAKKKRCDLSIDKAVIVSNFKSGNKKVTFRWSLVDGGGNPPTDYQFEADTGVDIADNEDEDEFLPVLVTAGTEFRYEHAFKSKRKAFSYNVNVQRKLGANKWEWCGSLDPIIVSRG